MSLFLELLEDEAKIMMIPKALYSLLATLALADAALFEAIRQVPQGWQDVGSAPASARMHFRIAMTHVSTHCETSRVLPQLTPSPAESWLVGAIPLRCVYS